MSGTHRPEMISVPPEAHSSFHGDRPRERHKRKHIQRRSLHPVVRWWRREAKWLLFYVFALVFAAYLTYILTRE